MGSCFASSSARERKGETALSSGGTGGRARMVDMLVLNAVKLKDALYGTAEDDVN
jgi:hypothetical protein